MTQGDSKGIRVVRVDEVKSQFIKVQAYHDKEGKPVVLVQNQTLKDVLSADGTIDSESCVRHFVLRDG